MPIVDWLLSWWNVPFLLPLGLSGGLMGLELVTGGLSELASLDFDVDVDVDADVDVDVDADVDVAADFGLLAGLGWLGLGKAPLSVLVEVLLCSFGTSGLLVAGLLYDLVPGLGPWSLLLSVPVASVAAVLVTRSVGLVIARLMPARPDGPVAGCYVGELGRSTMIIDARSGEVEVHGKHGVAFVQARAMDEIPRGVPVLLQAFDREETVYTAVVSEL